MRIGVYPELNHLSGGVYQYGLTMLHALHEMTRRGLGDEFLVFAYPDANHPAVAPLRGPGWKVEPALPPTLRRRAHAALGRALGERHTAGGAHRLRGSLRRLAGRGAQGGGAPSDTAAPTDGAGRRTELGRWFRRCGSELMIYPAASSLAFEAGLPCVMAVHDLQHRLQPEFPEVSAGGEWERREYLYRNAARHAALLVTDSEVGREDVLNFYGEHGATPERVKVLPFLPAYYLPSEADAERRRRVREVYRLPERYLFYPAQFWPHKNHAAIVRALEMLKRERGVEPEVVFCGSPGGEIRQRTFREVMALARRLGVERQVIHLGYVPDEEIAPLYAEAVALVMPTFFGPTNIPILEAWALDCAVLTSDVRGVREQAGDAGLLVDPRSAESVAEGIHKLWTDDALRAALVERGRARRASYGRGDYCRQLGAILEEAKTAVRGHVTRRGAV